MTDRKPFVGGNWKMNTTLASASELSRGIASALVGEAGVDVAVFPPFPYLLTVGGVLRDRATAFWLGAQDVYYEDDGAYTGEVSVAQLLDCGTDAVLVGHSERRHVIGETDAVVNRKTLASLRGGLRCILCVGETLEERERGEAQAVCERQVRAALADVRDESLIESLVIAYEPVWAIGTGKTATPTDPQTAHLTIRGVVAGLYGTRIANRLRIVYGGSVKASNARDLFTQPDIDGGLIGGASLKVDEFVAIVREAGAASRAPQA